MKRLLNKIAKMFRRPRYGTVDSCQCDICIGMCKTPCLPTPQQAIKLMDLGMTRRLKIVNWMDPNNCGRTVETIRPRVEAGRCTFLNDGRCTLHNRGLKPLEGKLALHSISRSMANEIHDDIARVWADDKLTVKYYLKRRACVQE